MAKCPEWREGDFGSYDRCYATKEMEACECLGNEAFCDFYPEKRKAATQPKYGEWISVSDRLPEEKQSVLVHYVDGWMPIAFLLDGKWYQSGGETSWLIVTHWMPLPELPKEDTP